MGKWGDFFFSIVREVMHEMRGFTDLHERDVLFFIFSRTGLYGKEWEAIPLRHFMHGIKNSDGGIIAYPVAMGKNKLETSLKHLEAKMLIEVRRPPQRAASEYRIRTIEELDVPHIVDYMLKNQTDAYLSTFKRLPDSHRLPLDRGKGSPQPEVRVPPIQRQHNLPILKKPIPNLAPKARTASTSPRRIILTKKM